MTRTRPLIMVALSKLVPSKRNPRQTKPDRDAHRRLVASIRAHDLIEPLVVRPLDQDSGTFQIVAGHRRFAALKDVHRKTEPDRDVPCMLRDVDDRTAEAISLAENFPREPMHPLDEAEAFARLAGEEGKHAEAIASDFGVSPTYIRQRMKLATLDDVVKNAYRERTIDTGTAEAFSSVPPERQVEVWRELRGTPHSADHVRSVIAHSWIDASHALFDLALLPDGTVSRDLFSEKVLVERKAFMDAQAEALRAEQRAMQEDGWAEVVVGPQGDIQDRLYAMDAPPAEYDAETTRTLTKLQQRRTTWETKLGHLDENDETRADAIQAKIDALDEAETRITEKAKVHFGEATKALGTAFLMLDPDGRVRREYRLPRRRPKGNGESTNGDPVNAAAPTSEDLRDGQLAATFTHEALGVRNALLLDPLRCKRILVLALHEKVRKEAVAVHAQVNGTDVYVNQSEKFTSPVLEELRHVRSKLDPFTNDHSIGEGDAYKKLCDLPMAHLDQLVTLLTVETITSHPQNRLALVHQLAGELGVNVRTQWRPDAEWLGGYQKAQLMHLMAELRGPVYTPATDHRKKSELVEALAALFTAAAEGKLDDPALAERVNAWVPRNLRDS